MLKIPYFMGSIDLSFEIGALQLDVARNDSRISFLLKNPNYVSPPAPWNFRYYLPGGASELEMRLNLGKVYETEISKLEKC